MPFPWQWYSDDAAGPCISPIITAYEAHMLIFFKNAHLSMIVEVGDKKWDI